MRMAVLKAWETTDVAIMAAAVADFRPANPINEKKKKGTGPIALSLERTPDIIAEMGHEKRDRILVGFAAETDNLKENALDKLRRKGLDFIVANAVSGEEDAMGSDTSRAHIFNASGAEEAFPLLEKHALAEFVLDRAAKMWQKNG